MNTKADKFYQLHRGGETFIMPNAWDAGSAILLEQAGFEAIGTTSAGIAYRHGLPDGQDALDFETAVDDTREIAAAVSLPVSMDSENGYADLPEAVFDNMLAITASGVVGASIEDFNGNPRDPFYPIGLAVERVAAARAAGDRLDYPFILTARCECFLYGHANPFAEVVERVNRYHEAGADCLYVPGIRDLEMLRRLVEATAAPINAVMGLVGAPVTLADLAAAGVTRISIGGSLARAALGLVRRAAVEMLQQGSFGFADGQIADDELCRLFAGRLGK